MEIEYIVIRPECTLIGTDTKTGTDVKQVYPKRITIEYSGIDFDINDIIALLKAVKE